MPLESLSPETLAWIGGMAVTGVVWFAKFLVSRHFKKVDASEAAIMQRIETAVSRLEGKVDGMSENIATIASKVALVERDAKVAHNRLDEHRDMFKEIRSELRQ